jgi:hypothetical protein
MELIKSTNETVTVEFSREELRDLDTALGFAIGELMREPGVLKDLIDQCEGLDDPEEIAGLMLDADRGEQTVEQLEKALQLAERLLPKVHDLAEAITGIAYHKEP